jgi:hypothetical protein
MDMTPADILSSVVEYEEFRKTIISLKGDFPFGLEEMQQLGRVYFLLYSDTSENRNMENIRIGYRIVRICVAEKALEGIDDSLRVTMRALMEDSDSMEKNLEALVREIGIEDVENHIYTIERNLDSIRGQIDDLPRGMTKERFVGGISKFYNGMYLINMYLKKMKSPGAPGGG